MLQVPQAICSTRSASRSLGHDDRRLRRRRPPPRRPVRVPRRWARTPLTSRRPSSSPSGQRPTLPRACSAGGCGSRCSCRSARAGRPLRASDKAHRRRTLPREAEARRPIGVIRAPPPTVASNAIARDGADPFPGPLGAPFHVRVSAPGSKGEIYGSDGPIGSSGCADADAARPRGRCGSRRRTTRRTGPAASAARRRPRRRSRRR